MKLDPNVPTEESIGNLALSALRGGKPLTEAAISIGELDVMRRRLGVGVVLVGIVPSITVHTVAGAVTVFATDEVPNGELWRAKLRLELERPE